MNQWNDLPRDLVYEDAVSFRRVVREPSSAALLALLRDKTSVPAVGLSRVVSVLPLAWEHPLTRGLRRNHGSSSTTTGLHGSMDRTSWWFMNPIASKTSL
jgi:hypothetical protein